MVAVFTVTEVGQRMRCSEMDLKSMTGSAATGAAGATAAGAGAVATSIGLATTAVEATGFATGVAGAAGTTAEAGVDASSIGLAAPGLRLTTTLKLGVKKRMPPAPTMAPNRKRMSPRKNAAMERFRSPP